MGIITGNGYGDAVFINGKIYILCYGYPDIEFEETHVAFLLTSDDNGETWELESNLSLNTGTSTSEADFTYSNEQNLLFGFSRSQNTDPRYLYYLESSDKGTNWNHLMKLGAQGDCPDIFRLSDGRYIVIIRAYGNRNVYMGYFTLPSEFPSLSYANKTNLLENIKIECMVKGTFGTSHGDIAYPSIVSLEDGKIMIAYYDIGAGGVFAKLIDEENI